MSSQAIAYAAEHGDAFVRDLEELLSIPSISTQPSHRSDMERAAAWLERRLGGSGLQAQTIGSGHPLVYAEWLGAEGAPTILVYGHYDVQPADPLDLWQTPPFEPSIRNGNIYARGAADDKGQVMTLVEAAASLMATEGRLPVNVRFLIEGQEECGGESVEAYVREHGDRLRADVVQVADTQMFAPGIPTIETGLRGIVAAEIHVRGATRDLHSGVYGGAAPNPLVALAQIIAGLKDPDGTITIPHFYDDVRMPDDYVRRSWRELPFDEERYREDIGSKQLVGESGYTPLERTWARPTLDVHGIVGGYQGEGSKTVIPAEATAKISTRLVPAQRADHIFHLLQARVREVTPPGVHVDVRLHHATDPVVVPSDSHFLSAARMALEETFGRPAVLTRSGGSIPIVGTFKDVLGMDCVLMGWSLPDDNLHAPNEKFSLDNFHKGIEATIRFWNALGAV